jgi:excisionase family DNA binding protein
MDIPEVTEETGWSRAKVYRLIREEKLPHVQLSSRRIVVPREAFHAWLAEQNARALAGVKR